MSPFKMLVVVTTIVASSAIGSASAQVSDSPTGPIDHTTRTVPKSSLSFEAAGGFAGVLDELLILPDGRARASRLLLGKRQVRWSVLSAAETAALNQAVAALFPVPGKHGSGSGDMRWKIRRTAKDKHQQFSTTDPSGHGRHVIQWMSALHQDILRHGVSSHWRILAIPALSLVPGVHHSGQVIGLAGPVVSPDGPTIQIAIVNNTRDTITLPNPCPYRILDTDGRVVFAPICPAVLVRVPPGGVHRMNWDQVDDQGRPVAEGTYVVEFTALGLAPVTIRTTSAPIHGTVD